MLKKNYKRITIENLFISFICLMLLSFATYLTPSWVANNLSPDGILTQDTIYKIENFRIQSGIFGTVILLSIILNLIKGIPIEILKEQNSKIPLIIKLILFADLTLAFIYLNSHNIFYMEFFDLNSENSIPTWYSSIQLFCISVLSGLFAYRKFNRINKCSWILFILPLSFLTLSMDESASIHERLGFIADSIFLNAPRKGTIFINTGVWMFAIGIPFIVFFITLMFSIKRYFDKKNYLLILFGMGTLLLGALGAEAICNFVPNKLLYIEICCEELLEMLGATIIFWGFYNLTRTHLHTVLTAVDERIPSAEPK